MDAAAALPHDGRKRRRRALFICAEDTPESAAACEWALSNVYREGDVLHMTFVVRCLQPQTEIFHGVVGGSYSVSASAGLSKEHHALAEAQRRLEERFLPLLRPHLVPYQLHLYAERTDAGLDRVAQLLLQDMETRDADLVVLAAHNKPGAAEGLGGVAGLLQKQCRRPLALVRPQPHGQ